MKITPILMKISPILTVCALVFTGSVQAESNFPSYINGKYCNDLKRDFITTTIGSLRSYRQQQLTSKHRGGMNNIRNFVQQQETWLKECDQYLQTTQRNRIFQDDKTTRTIFDAMASVTLELDALIKGITYSVEGGSKSTDVAADKFDQLFKLVDDHQTLMLLKGQLVFR